MEEWAAFQHIRHKDSKQNVLLTGAYKQLRNAQTRMAQKAFSKAGVTVSV